MSESALGGWLSSLGRHPKGFWFIFWGELAERSSYYGMRAILALYMVEKLGFSEGDSAVAMSLFIAACYFLPLCGGWVADNIFGKYWTIVGFSVPYIIGHLILGIEDRIFCLIALSLLAMGTGVIKPNISTLMGLTYDQQRPGDEALRTDAFGLFYMAINIGAVISQFSLPYVKAHYSYQVAFAFPAALMVIAFLAFAAGKKHYAVEKVDRSPKLTPDEARAKGLIPVLIGIMFVMYAVIVGAKLAKFEYMLYLGAAGYIVFTATMWKVLGRLGMIFAIVTFFWAIFDQSASTWIFFAKSDFNLDVWGFHIEPDAIQAVNGFMVIFLVPAFAILWRAMKARGRDIRATDKMQLGFILTASTMAIMAFAGFGALGGMKVSIAWQVIAYFLLTCAEVCISVVGLELAFTAAPLSMKSVVTACWLLCVSVANLCINTPIAELYDKMKPAWYFSLLTALMLPVIVIFALVAPGFNREVAEKKASEKPAEAPPEGAVAASS